MPCPKPWAVSKRSDEDLIDEMKKEDTIILVRHNTQQVARVIAAAGDLERTADCATNTTAKVICMVDGKIILAACRFCASVAWAPRP